MKASEAIWKLMNAPELEVLRKFTHGPSGFLGARYRAGEVLDRLHREMSVLRIMIAQVESDEVPCRTPGCKSMANNSIPARKGYCVDHYTERDCLSGCKKKPGHEGVCGPRRSTHPKDRKARKR